LELEEMEKRGDIGCCQPSSKKMGLYGGLGFAALAVLVVRTAVMIRKYNVKMSDK
jgi:hypothetical protein